MPLLGHAAALPGDMGRTAVLEEDDVPAPPMGANHGEEGLMCFLDPFVGDQQEQLTTPDIEHAMEDAAGMGAHDGDAHLLADTPIVLVQG